MKGLQVSFEAYLKRLGRIGEIPLGEQRPTAQDNQLFLNELKKRGNSNSIFVIIAFAMLIALFVIGVILIFHYRDSPKLMGAAFGGTFLSLLAIVGKLRQLWLEKFIIDHASLVLQNFSPEQAAEFILQLYRSFISKSNDQKK
jgi:hypothetical protein